MKSETLQYQLDSVLESDKDKVIFTSNGFKRVERHFNNSCSQLVDIHLKHGLKIHYLRISSEAATKKISFLIAGTICNVLKCSELGILLTVDYENRKYTVWLPSVCDQFRFDKYQRFTVSDEPFLSYQWEFNSCIQLNLLLSGNISEIAIIPYVIMEDPNGQFAEELRTLSEVERCLYRKSDWFFAKTPSDVWNYLINGSIYDPRSHKGIDKRFKCQQCAYAWWNYFGFLYKETGKKVYDIMQDEIAYSVLLDMSSKGEWGHGYWSDDIETHARFHLDGVHLLISQYEKTDEPMWLEASERGITFVSKHLMEELDDGSMWFLHDTIEHGIHPHFKSTLFGKTPGNSLCINTHVQALTVLYRLSHLIPDKKIYSEMFGNGVRALRRVLDYQPGELIYRLLMFMLMKYKTRRSAQSIMGKLRNASEGLIIPRIYWSVRRHFPRIVFPCGFTERDLTFSFFSDRYHITNLKDLLTLYQQVPSPWLRSYIKNGFIFIRKFLAKSDLTNALASSPYYIELIDILYMYNKLIENITSEEMDSVKEAIYQQTGGYSLDYYASALVRGK